MAQREREREREGERRDNPYEHLSTDLLSVFQYHLLVNRYVLFHTRSKIMDKIQCKDIESIRLNKTRILPFSSNY